MADTIQHKRSGVPGRQVPLNNISDGELFVNVADGTVYLKRAVDAAPNFSKQAIDNPGNLVIAADRLLSNREFIQSEVVAYVEQEESNVSLSDAQTELCRRDTGFIVDAVVTDLRKGGIFHSAEAAIAYYNNGVSVLPEDQTQPTTNAIGLIKTISSNVIQNTEISQGNLYQTNIKQDTGTRSGETVEPSALTTTNSLLDGISDTISAPLDRRLSVVASEQLVNPKEIHVDGYYGDDANNGTEYSKVKTIKRACEIAAQNQTKDITDPTRLPVLIKVAPGDYTEDNPVRVPSNTSIIGDGLRAVTIRPANRTPENNLGANASWFQNGIPDIEEYSRGRFDLFLVNSGCYFGGFTVRDVELLLPTGSEIDNPVAVPDLSGTGPTLLDAVTGFVFAFDNGATIIRSPYIDNASCITRATDPNDYRPDITVTGTVVAGGGFIADSKMLSSASVLNSMVINSFTQINEGGIGCKLRGAAFAQVVSFFTNFCLVGTICVDGGHATIANSNNSFGDFGLLAVGGRVIQDETGNLEIFSSLITATGQDFSFVGSGNTFLDPPFIGNDSFFDADVYSLAGTREVSGNVFVTITDPQEVTGSGNVELFFADGINYLSTGQQYNLVLDRTGTSLDAVNFLSNSITSQNMTDAKFTLDIGELYTSTEFRLAENETAVENVFRTAIAGVVNIYDNQNDSALPPSQKGLGVSDVGTFAVSVDNRCVNQSAAAFPTRSFTGGALSGTDIVFSAVQTVSELEVGYTVAISGTGVDLLDGGNFVVTSVNTGASTFSIANPDVTVITSSVGAGNYAVSAPGRVFYTGTDELGDFRIGNDLVIRQRTGLIEGRTFQRSQSVLMLPFVLALEG